MSARKSQVKRFLWNQLIRKTLFSPALQEGLWREAFFYNAFKALSYNGIDGDYVEFGCMGRTFSMAYHESRRHNHEARLWAFDSFQGLPAPKETSDSHPRWKEGILRTSLDNFHAICASHGIPSADYNVVPGFYDQTLAHNSPDSLPANIALAYIDCDLYSSAQTVLQFLMPRLKHGMIIAFDDYFCWSASQLAGERKAMLECFSNDDTWALLPYVQYGWHGNSFVVEEKSLTASIPNASVAIPGQPVLDDGPAATGEARP
jgi:O-methyltransferase